MWTSIGLDVTKHEEREKVKNQIRQFGAEVRGKRLPTTTDDMTNSTQGGDNSAKAFIDGSGEAQRRPQHNPNLSKAFELN